MSSDAALDRVYALKEMQIHICNLVLTAIFTVNVDLGAFARNVGGAYRPSKFAAVRFRIKQPKCTLLVFKSGKCVCIGCTKVIHAEAAINQCFRHICGVDRAAKISNIRVQNIVSHTNIGKRVNLIKMSKENSMNISYDPELFPGLRMSLREQNARACVFFQGNIVVTGCKDFDTLFRVWQIVKARIDPYVETSEGALSMVTTSASGMNHSSSAVQRHVDRLTYNEDADVETMNDSLQMASRGSVGEYTRSSKQTVTE
ncbi:hypothetical protein CYMTET_3885 [Cymbomonas tetramitiformis]|uniref:Uncharacterized protein n=1 Tax=Cymbomonas tetramitiformis TaxID=36881 RepID=A0AAE0H2A0_9CHLO|nr:hypothetical protein CYMTET_3885 [Cymbomonas tetramitiformis]|eukprot:gene33022-42166_t